jgi:hypothetical protein
VVRNGVVVMSRGQANAIGDTFTSPNGYNYTKVETGPHTTKWRLTHHLVAEATMGRSINSDTETVRFKDGNRTNLSPDNIIVSPKKTGTASKRLAQLIAQRAEIDSQIKLLQAEIAQR